MTGHITTYLNIRTGAPKIFPYNNAGYYRPGDKVEILETVVGDDYKGNKIWYRVASDAYVWSGGVKRDVNTLVTVTAPDKEDGTMEPDADLSQLIVLNQGLSPGSAGEGGLVAVLDSGVAHPLLNTKVDEAKNFVDPGAGAGDSFGHGTQVAGIIAGHTPYIKSVSHACRLLNYRIADNDGIVVSAAVLPALRALLQRDRIPDVVNLSFELTYPMVRRVQPLVNELTDRGTVVVVAAGSLDHVNTIGLLKNAVRVGTFEREQFMEIRQRGNVQDLFDWIFLNTPVISTTPPDDHRAIDDSSAYAAVVSSIVCGFLQAPHNANVQRNNRFKTVIDFMSRAGFPSVNENIPTPFKPLT